MWLYAQAILVGVSSAFSEHTIITYVGEIAHVKLRGPLFSVEKMGYGLGAFYAYLLSIYFDWRTLALVSSAIPITVSLLLLNVSLNDQQAKII